MRMHNTCVFVVALFVFGFPCSSSQKKCATNFGDYRLFGEKTFYHLVGGQLPDAASRAPASCEPVHMYLILRHGARYPGAQILPSLKKLKALTRKINETGQAKMCSQDLDALREWEIWTNEYDNKNQTEYGGQEMEGIAQRYKQLFPTLLGSSVSPSRLWFSSTNFQRTTESLASFKRELLRVPGDDAASNIRLNQAVVDIPDVEGDPLYIKNCLRYKANYIGNKAASPIYNRFMKGYLIKRIARNIQTRLGVRRKAFPRSMLQSLYSNGCYYQQWVEGHNGPWCKIFKPEELRILEFANDIKGYEIKGLGAPLSYKKNCFVSKDIIGSLKTARNSSMNGEEHWKGKFRVLHVSNIVTLAASFRLYNYEDEDPPRPRDYIFLRDRKNSLSKMIPTAGHLNFVLYRCGEDDYKVQIYWNERIVQIPECTSAVGRLGSLCDLDEMLRIFPDFVAGSPTECNQDKICSL